MSTLNINSAGTFGILSDVLVYNVWNDNINGTYQYSYGYVDSNPIYNAWWSITYPSTYPGNLPQQTTENVQAMQNMFTDSSSISPGALANTGYLTYYWQFASLTPDTSTMTITAVPVPEGSYNVDLSTATQVSDNDAVVADSSLQFVFIPGATQSQTLSYSEGATISEQVTNGITSTTTNAQGQTVALSETCATSYTGGVPGDTTSISASESAAISYAWSQTSSQSTNYTTSNTSQTSTMVASSTTVDLDTATPNADGTYTYGSYTLVPGQTYVAQITLSEASWNAPINQEFQISGPPMAVPNGTSYDTDGDGLVNYIAYQDPITAEQAIYYANTYGYSLISGCDTSLFTYTTGQTDYVTYTGLVSSTSAASVNATVVIQAVATTASADNTTETATNSSAAMQRAVTTTASADNTSETATNSPIALERYVAEPTNLSSPMLDLELAATKLKASHGVYFNTATPGVENNLIAQYLSGDADGLLSLNGGNQDTAILGDLNYFLTGFTNSNVTVGNGDNQIVIDSTGNGNRFVLGDGNNSISLDGQKNNLYIGDGANYIEVTGGAGKNYIIDGTGTTALMINSEIGFTQVSKWDQTKDTLHFGSNLNLSDVEVTFNYNDWSYNVYVKDNLVANLLTVGGLSLSDPTTTITSSAAYVPTAAAIETDQGFLTGLYADAFTRAPDAAGLLFWTEELGAGVSRNAVIQDFLVSSEYDLAHLSNSEYVNGLYKDILGRQEDAAGSTYWIDQLDSGASRVSVVGAFLGSAEYNNLI